MIEPVRQGAELIEEIERTTPAPGSLSVWWLGQSGFLIKSRAGLLAIDPYLSEHLTKKYEATDRPHVRMTRAPIRGGDLRGVDLVLASHTHSDHLDPGTLPDLMAASTGAVLALSEAIRGHAIGMGLPADRLIGIDARAGRESSGHGCGALPALDSSGGGAGTAGLTPATPSSRPEDSGCLGSSPKGEAPSGFRGEIIPIPDPHGGFPFPRGTIDRAGFRVRAVPSAHEGLDTDEEGRHLYLGFVIEAEGLRLYHSGDSLAYEGLADRLGADRFDVLFLPINGRDPARRVPGNMSAAEAVDLAALLKPRFVVPHHYDMFTFNTVPIAVFESEARRLPEGVAARVLRCGERWEIGS